MLLLAEGSKPARCLDPVSTFRTVVQTDRSRDIYDSILVGIVAISRLPARLGATTTQRFGVKKRDQQMTMAEGQMLRTDLLEESDRLVECLLSSNQVEMLLQTAEGIAAGIENVDLTPFWRLDASIGGIGGYCLLPSLRPFGNPFSGGIARELFRPIQYAAAEIEYHNSELMARAGVWFSGMHLEAVTKYWVNKTTSPLNANHYKRLTLGQSIGILKDGTNAANEIFEPLDSILALYNPAKHKIPQDRDRMFTVGDALVVYVSSRILSTRILKPYYDEILHGIPEREKKFPGLNMHETTAPGY